MPFPVDSQEKLFGKQKRTTSFKDSWESGQHSCTPLCSKPKWIKDVIKGESWETGLVMGCHSTVHVLDGNEVSHVFSLPVAAEGQGREASASFLAHSGRSSCDLSPTTSALCLREIGGVTNPPSGCRVTWTSCCKDKLGATVGTREAHFHFMAGS